MPTMALPTQSTFRSTLLWFLWTALFSVSYGLVLVSCVSLLFRLLLQSTFLWSGFFCCIYGITWYVLANRQTADFPTQKARIKRVKTIPAEPHPALHQKTFCWVSFIDDDDADEHDNDPALFSSGTIVQAVDLVSKEDPEEDTSHQSHEQLIQDIRTWSLDHPCIIVSVGENVKIGDTLTVHLTNGDPSKPFYMPYQKETQQRMKYWILKSAVRGLLSLVALWFLFGGQPVFFANSQSLADSINTFWNAFWDSAFDSLSNVFPALAEDDDDPDLDTDDEECRIPPYVDMAYDFLILIQIGCMSVGPLIFYKRTKAIYGMDEPPADSYQLLRGDEDEDELADRDGIHRSAPAGHVVVE